MQPPDRESAPPLPPWIDRLVPFRRSRVRAGQYRLHVMEQGTGRAVLMLHGNPTWGLLWRKVAAELAGEPLRLVMPDLLGLGFSDRPRDPREHTLERHGDCIARLIEQLDLTGLVLVCQDWGGPIGTLALSESGRAAGLVVLNTVLGPPRPGFRPTRFHRFARVPLLSDAAFRLLGFPQSALWLAQGDRSSIRGTVARAYRYPLRGLSQNAAPLALARMVPDSLDHPSIPALGACQRFAQSFAGPAAIVWGDRDPVLGRAFGRVRDLLPQAEVTRTRAGHFLQEEVPGEIASAIRSVVAQATRHRAFS